MSDRFIYFYYYYMCMWLYKIFHYCYYFIYPLTEFISLVFILYFYRLFFRLQSAVVYHWHHQVRQPSSASSIVYHSSSLYFLSCLLQSKFYLYLDCSESTQVISSLYSLNYSILDCCGNPSGPWVATGSLYIVLLCRLVLG